MQIDWSKIAEPQRDGYDSQSVLDLCGKSLKLVDADPYKFCDGLVAVRDRKKQTAPWLVTAPLDHPNIARAEAMLKLWPEGYRCFIGLINVFYPLSDKERPDIAGYGSTCGSDESEFGALYATVYSDLGLAEALVHELGHTKLRGLGIMLEHHDGRLIENRSDELYESPVRKDKPRPMSAVFHAQYSYTNVLALDVAVAEQTEHSDIKTALEMNARRMREGRETLLAHLRMTDEGESFFLGYFTWLDRLLERAETLLSKTTLPVQIP